MSVIDDGGAAFPLAPVGTGDPRDGMAGGSVGMTLRDYFAAKVMQGLIAQKFGDDAPVDEVCAVVAYTSFQFADAMLAERSKGGSL